MLEGGDTGPAILPGNARDSLLTKAIRHEDDLVMPPAKPRLPTETISRIERWIDLGAPVPDSAKTADSGNHSLEMIAKSHWAFRPIKQPAIPRASNPSWARTPIDAFILAKLDEQHWRPAPAASTVDWIRRVTYDLTGLPPTTLEIARYLDDRSPDADERLVDRLLASPHYGARWGQHWLDVVRFAESEGFEYDRHIPGAWRYRDYVIQSFNEDKPFDRFVTEQIAGDEIDPSDRTCLTASAFHRIGPIRRNAGNPEVALSRNEVLTERTDIVGSAFLGLTIGCARCHNHKLEPIPQKDYYRLQAYIASTAENNVSTATTTQAAEWDAKRKSIPVEIKNLQAKLATASASDKVLINQRIDELREQLLVPPHTIPATRNDFASRTKIHLLKRGVWENKGEPVGPRPLSVLVDQHAPELAADVGDPRTQLARWLTAPNQPLTARVIVNRIWQQHFGIGLVKTANDFGTKGERPSHPELIDWLASTLVQQGWRLKPVHRAIVMSATYRQSSRTALDPEVRRVDPENRLLSHFNRRRLSAEEIRDSMLSVSGRLNLKMGGPSVMVPIDEELRRLLLKPFQWQSTTDPAENDRRTVFLISKRNLRLPFLEVFDAPSLLTTCARRESSTHAPQALELLNGPFVNELAAAFADRLQRESRTNADDLAKLAYRLALGREPAAAEYSIATDFLRDQPLKEFALAVFNLNGFHYVF
jgi:hypothetical protein